MNPVRLGVVEIKVHLARIGMGELADFQIDNYKATQFPVKEDQVHPIPFVTDAQPFLPADETEITPELQQEGFQVTDECLFEIRLRVFILESEKLQDIRVLYFFLGCNDVRRQRPPAFLQHGGLVL